MESSSWCPGNSELEWMESTVDPIQEYHSKCGRRSGRVSFSGMNTLWFRIFKMEFRCLGCVICVFVFFVLAFIFYMILFLFGMISLSELLSNLYVGNTSAMNQEMALPGKYVTVCFQRKGLLPICRWKSFIHTETLVENKIINEKITDLVWEFSLDASSLESHYSDCRIQL